MPQDSLYGTGWFYAAPPAQYRANNPQDTGNNELNSAPAAATLAALLPGADVAFTVDATCSPRKRRRKNAEVRRQPWEQVLDLSVDADTARNAIDSASAAAAPTSGSQRFSTDSSSAGPTSEPWMQHVSSFSVLTTPQTRPRASALPSLPRHPYQTPSRSLEDEARSSELAARLEPAPLYTFQPSLDISSSGARASRFESPEDADVDVLPLADLSALLTTHASLQGTPRTPADLIDTPDLTPDLNNLDDHGPGNRPYSTVPSSSLSNPFPLLSTKMKTFSYEEWSLGKGLKSVYQAERVVDFLRTLKLSAINFFELLIDQSNTQFVQIQNALHREDSNALERILYAFQTHTHINDRFHPWLKEHGVDIACELVAKEVMETSKDLGLPVPELTSEKLMGWSMGRKEANPEEEAPCILDQMPVWSKIINVAVGDSQTKARAKRTPERDTTVGKCVITHMIQNMRSQKSTTFTTLCGIALYSFRVPRHVIDALNHIGFCCSYNTAISAIEVLLNAEVQKAKAVVLSRPFGIGYDNFNRSISVHVEQRGAEHTPEKTTAGIVMGVYALVNADLRHMELKPMLERLLKAPSLTRYDVRPSSKQIKHSQHQLQVHKFNAFADYTDGFDHLRVSPLLRFTPWKLKIPGQMSQFHLIQTNTINESTVEGNVMMMEDIFGNQMVMTDEQIERIAKYAIPVLVDQLTTSRLRTGFGQRGGDINAFYTLLCFMIGICFGPFHLVLNLIWCLLKIHRHHFTQIGSLAYFFNVLEKKRLKNDNPDYRTLLNSLMQILDGALIAAWELELKERNLGTPEEFAASEKLTTELMKEISRDIMEKYATGASDSNEVVDTLHENLRLLMRDLLVVREVSMSIAGCDWGRVEDLIPEMACIFREAGSNNYASELLHWIYNVKHVWTPEFADIMRHNIIVDMSGNGHGMGVDMNIEHIIGWLKDFTSTQGAAYAPWRTISNVSASICTLYNLKTKFATSLGARYQGRSHKVPDISLMARRVADRITESNLLVADPSREGNEEAVVTKDLIRTGTESMEKTIVSFATKTTHIKNIAALSSDEEYTGDIESLAEAEALADEIDPLPEGFGNNALNEDEDSDDE